MVERGVREWETLGPSLDDGVVDRFPSPGHGKHVRTLIEPYHDAAVSIM